MNETELERMVVRLLGDGSDFQKMLTEAQTSAKQAASQIEQSAKKIEDLGNSVKGFAANAVEALAALGGAKYLKGGIDKAIEFERNAIKMRAAIEMNTDAVDTTIKSHLEFSKRMSESSVSSKGQIMSLLKRAEAFGVTGEKAQEAARMAMALASATDTDAESAIRITAELAKGTDEGVKHAQMFSRMIPQLRGVRDQHEYLEKVQKLSTMGMKVMGQEAESTYGQLEHMDHAIQGLKKDIGAFVFTLVKPFIKFFTEASEQIKKLSPETKRWLALLMMVATVITGWSPTIKLVTAALGPLRAAFMALLTPLGPLFLLVGGLMAMWIQEMGGVEKAWNAVKKTGLDFWNWIQPVWKALVSLVEQLWKTSKELLQELWNFAKKMWAGFAEVAGHALKAIGLDGEINFTKMRDKLVEAIQFMEFSLTHFQLVWKLAWAGMKYYAAIAADFIAKHIFEIALGLGFLKLIRGMASMWKMGWLLMAAAAVLAVGTIGFIIGRVIGEALKKAFKGEIISKEQIGEIVKDVQTDLETALGKIGIDLEGVQIEGLGKLKDKLKKELDDVGAEVGNAFSEWKTKKFLTDFTIGLITGQEGKGAFDPIAESAKKAKEEIKALDSVTKGSAESIKRISDYMDKMGFKTPNNRPPNAAQRQGIAMAMAGGQAGPIQERLPRPREANFEDAFRINKANFQRNEENQALILGKILKVLESAPVIMFSPAGMQ